MREKVAVFGAKTGTDDDSCAVHTFKAFTVSPRLELMAVSWRDVFASRVQRFRLIPRGERQHSGHGKEGVRVCVRTRHLRAALTTRRVCGFGSTTHVFGASSNVTRLGVEHGGALCCKPRGSSGGNREDHSFDC